MTYPHTTSHDRHGSAASADGCRDRVLLCLGDAREVLAAMPSTSVDCVVTSPPYWGLRDYRVNGQHGAEPTIEQYVDRLADVFDEVRRVLTPTGTAWLNLGDSFGSSWGNYVARGSVARTAAARSAQAYGGTGRPTRGTARRISSGSRGVSRSPCRTGAGCCGTRWCGRRPTAVRRASGTGCPRAHPSGEFVASRASPRGVVSATIVRTR